MVLRKLALTAAAALLGAAFVALAVVQVAAAEAGDLNASRKDETVPFKLTLRRGETTTTVSYLPRGAPAEGYRRARDPKTPRHRLPLLMEPA